MKPSKKSLAQSSSSSLADYAFGTSCLNYVFVLALLAALAALAAQHINVFFLSSVVAHTLGHFSARRHYSNPCPCVQSNEFAHAYVCVYLQRVLQVLQSMCHLRTMFCWVTENVLWITQIFMNSRLLTKTMKQFGCSVFDGPFWGFISWVFDVRRDFLAGYFFRQFDIRSKILYNFVSSSIFDCVYF